LQNKPKFGRIITELQEGVRIMANIKSSKKAVKTIAKKTENNHELKATVKNYIKNCDKAIASGDKKAATECLNNVQKNIDKAVSKGFIKANTAAREKSRLNEKVKNMK
jgi:small subunit ribosomal protein S20